jgi:hypothetical protein
MWHHVPRQTVKLAGSDHYSLLLIGRRIDILLNIRHRKTMLSDERITAYQKLYKNRFGREISREDALEQGTKLIRMMELIYKPITEKEHRLLEERRKELSD